jgi:transposase
MNNVKTFISVNINMSELLNLDRSEFICKAYVENTHSMTELQKLLKISPNDIYKILKENNIELKGKRLSKEKQLLICEEYLKGKTIKQIQKEFSVAPSCIGKYLKKHNIKTRDVYKKYEIDESLFENIDTFEKAQFLGLIYSDGTLAKHNKAVSIRLREDDSEYLDDWRVKFLKSTKPLGYSRQYKMTSPLNNKTYEVSYGCAILDITCKKMYENFIKIGLCCAKTWANLSMPDIPEQYKLGFLLGLFEGDGCVTYTRKTSRCLTIACQENMANDIKKYLDSIGIFSCVYDRKQVFIIQIARKDDLHRIYDLFYSNASIYMKRKKLKFEEMLNASDVSFDLGA